MVRVLNECHWQSRHTMLHRTTLASIADVDAYLHTLCGG